jgi:hypothetical protein
MGKCNICNEKIKELFLGKLKGTVIRKEGSSKKYEVCFACQKKFPSNEELLSKL